jgi:GT2 family glycosyltransferase
MLCRRDPTVLDLALRLLPPRIGRRRQAWHTMQDRDYSQSFDVPCASGCCLLIRTRLWRDLGGFDERFFLYLEDADLTRRVRQIARAVYVPESTVVHAWQRGSYRSLRLALTHLVSLARYFSKWGWRWR